MGQIIAFVPSERHDRRPPTADGGEVGRILLFTGVRYERHAGGARPQGGPGDRPRSRRRRGA